MFDKKKRPEASVANYFKKLCVKLPKKKVFFHMKLISFRLEQTNIRLFVTLSANS